MSIERDRVRHLRRNMTDAEKFVWGQLRGRRFAGYKFRRQAQIGPYIADFICYERRLIVQLDDAHPPIPNNALATSDGRRGWRSRGFAF